MEGQSYRSKEEWRRGRKYWHKGGKTGGKKERRASRTIPWKEGKDYCQNKGREKRWKDNITEVRKNGGEEGNTSI